MAKHQKHIDAGVESNVASCCYCCQIAAEKWSQHNRYDQRLFEKTKLDLTFDIFFLHVVFVYSFSKVSRKLAIQSAIQE